MGQITATRNLVAIKVVRHAGQWRYIDYWHRVQNIIIIVWKLLCGDSCFIDIDPRGQISNKPVQVMLWYAIGVKPLAEPMIAQLTSPMS